MVTWQGRARPRLLLLVAAILCAAGVAAETPLRFTPRALPLAEAEALFKSPKGVQGPCPRGGVYSGAASFPRAVGFCCDALVCNTCGGPKCNEQTVRMGTGSSGAVSANVCCDGWLRTNFHFTYCHNGTLPCQFLPPPEGWQHAHAQGGDQNVLLAEEEPEAELKELEASTQIFAAPSGDKRVFESCAVVSSSPSMLDSQYGEAIDAHSAVIRFNMAKTAGYEADVGSRTTLMVVNDVVANHPSIWIKNCKDYEMGIWFVYDYMKSNIRTFTTMRVKVYAPADCKFTINTNYTEAYKAPWFRIVRLWSEKHRLSNVEKIPRLSSGWMGILHSTIGGLCRTVDLYGWDRHGARFSAGHYYDPTHNYTAHAYNLETILLDFFRTRYNFANKEWGASVTAWPWKNPAVKPKGDGTFDK